METDLSFCSLCEKMDTVSVCILATAAPLDFRRPPTTSGFPPLPVNFFTVAKRKGPAHLLLIYLGHAWENGGVLRGSWRGRIRERGCDRREIKPLKVMPCLIFRSTNELSCSHPQTSSQAAIIAGRESELGRQKGENITSPSVSTACVCGGVVCVCQCEKACLYLSVCVCLHPASSLPACLCVA